MNSMIEYIRQINQTAVTLKPEWLDRLRHVDAGADAASLTPEIVLAEPGERKIPKFQAGNWEPPITQVNQPNTANSFEQATAPTTTTPDTNTDTPQTPVAESNAPLSQDNLYEYYTNSISTTDPVTPAPGPQVELPPEALAPEAVPQMRRVDPMAETKISEEKVTDPQPAKNNVVASAATVNERVSQNISEVSESIQKVQATSLDTPAVLDGIVRPTIMPLRRNVTTDVFSRGEPVPTTNHDSTAQDTSAPIPQQATTNTSPAAEATQAPQTESDPIPHPPSQIIEIINGLEGTSFDALQQQDTVPQQEWVEYTSEKSASKEIQQPIEVTSIEQTVAEKDAPVIDPQPKTTDDAPLKNGPAVSFPTDKRGQRFHYALTKKQKLVNSITDQVVERFPVDSPSTIMLVSANREVDVDGAASKIATCLATREHGEILLVDGNLESRQLTTVLGMVSESGIADSCVKNEDASQHISPTDNQRLSVLCAGTTEAASAAGQGPAPTTTHSSLRERFNYSIISGGIPGDPLTDSWVQLVDGVYLLVDMDQSDRHDSVAAVDYLRKLGARLVGCIAIRS